MRFLRVGSPLRNRLARQQWVRSHRTQFGREAPGRRQDQERLDALGRSVRPGHPPRILVDVSVILRHDARTGIQRVVRAVWLELQRASGPKLQVVPVFASHTHGYCYAPPDFLGEDGLTPPRAHGPVAAGPGDVFLGLDLAAHLLPKYTAQIAGWRAAGATVHLVVYDLLPITHPQWFQASTRRNMGLWLRSLIRHADQALCISTHVATQLQGWLDRCPGKRTDTPRIATICLGADIAATMPTKGLLPDAQALLDRTKAHPTVLMVGTIEPRKAYDVALRALELLWRACPAEAPRLVIVGKPGWKTADLQARMRGHPELGSRLEWLPAASDEFLERLYASCSILLMTSYAEGFGLPLVEAANHGMPVLVRDLPVFREHELPNLTYFADDDPARLGEMLMTLVRTSAIRAGAGAHAALPTWSGCVRDLLHALEVSVPVLDTGPAASVEAVP